MAGLRSIRSFVVRAFRDRDDELDDGEWRGHVSDVDTGERTSWTEADEIGSIVDSGLARDLTTVDTNTDGAPSDSVPAPVDDHVADGVGGAHAVAPLLMGAPMAGPEMSVVIGDLLDELDDLLTPAPPLPDPNVTVDRASEKLVGLGGIRGLENTAPIGIQTLKGGRLDATVRFQVWGGSATEADLAVTDLQGAVLDNRDSLRSAGFLKVDATTTTFAEHVPAENGWRRSASYDVLYEYHYTDSDNATSLIARIPVGTELNEADGSPRETETVRDRLVRWDREGAAGMTVRGPVAIDAIDVRAFVPAAPTGDITLARTSALASGPPAAQPDLATFLAVIGGDEPTEVHASVTVSVATFLAALTAIGDPLELGDWDGDTAADSHDGLVLPISPELRLPAVTDAIDVHHSDPGGLDTDAVLHIRVHTP